jgi:EAL domain-containing protein (putative c-di-GMP-specific phosphodiesterase class I)
MQALLATRARLHAAGVLFAVDDAGTGYSAPELVELLRPDHLKRDRSLVCAIHRNRAHQQAMRAWCELAHAVGCVVIAEGVGEDAELACVSALGARCAQGYLFGRPAPPHAFSVDTPVRLACAP